MHEITELSPKSLWQNFANICQIPHISGHETQITQYLKTFGEKQGLETIVDSVGNVLIKKPAIKGMENKQGVILQAHIDMVPQKDSEIIHDFLTDPIQPIIDGDWVRAKGTTLGADDGIGVAAIMSILQDKTLQHGPLECLFTVDEEDGLRGINNIKAGFLQGQILLNLDGEVEDEFCIGSAGAIRVNAKIKYQKEPFLTDMLAYSVKVFGLHGGHSGVNIHLKRGNAIKIINHFLSEASKLFTLRISSIDGGVAHNAIPTNATAIIAIPKTSISEFMQFADHFLDDYLAMKTFSKTSKIQLKVETILAPELLLDIDTQSKLLRALSACPNGVAGMSLEVPGLVETSANLGVIKTNKNDGIITINTMQRSSVNFLGNEISEMVANVFELIGAEIEYFYSYIGWEPNLKSPILQLMQKTYAQIFGHEARALAVHAGLECGSLKKMNPSLDMISFGPTIVDVHSSNERVNIASVNRFWEFLIAILGRIYNAK